jgi:hypothetical protein
MGTILPSPAVPEGEEDAGADFIADHTKSSREAREAARSPALAALTVLQAQSVSTGGLLSVNASHKSADARVQAEVRIIRRQLGLSRRTMANPRARQVDARAAAAGSRCSTRARSCTTALRR